MKLIINDVNPSTIRVSKDLRQKILNLARLVPGEHLISLTFVDDKTIKKLNKQFRRKNKPTDVLSFDMDENELLGDVVISKQTARKDAKKFGVSFDEEVLRLVAHGVLHLLGYSHVKKGEKTLMLKKENEILHEVM